MMGAAQIVLDIRDLTVDLPAWADRPQAVSDFSLSLRHDEILCVVGESGSGKSVMSRAVMGLLALHPEVLVADEPVSALDVSVQAQVLQLLSSIRDRFNLAMLFITHDLRVAAQVCDRIAVMRLGEIVEQGPTADVFAASRHPYTQELLSAVPGRAWEERRPRV